VASALPVDPFSNSQIVYDSKAGGVDEGEQSQKPLFQLDLRQKYLTWLWSFYKCSRYNGRKYNYDGTEAFGPTEKDTIATEGYIPNGFYDAGASSLPVAFRKPYAPYYLIREIVDRFTNLLFSEGRIPAIQVDGDDDSSDYYTALAEEGDLWEQLGKARTFGGGMSSVAVSFALVAGKPVFEVHDSRWCVPNFSDSAQRQLSRFEKKYVFQDVLRDQDDQPFKDADGRTIEGWFWYRRLIDAQQDQIWERIPARDNEEPDWDAWDHQIADHGIGVVPVRWIRNLAIEDGVDGEPDAAGCYELIEAFDICMSAAQKAIIANCDPWLAVMTDDDIDEITKKAGNALKLNKDATAQLLEITGMGPKLALELADKLRELAFEIAACVPDNQSTMSKASSKTATEVMALRSRMVEKAGKLRSNYGAAIIDIIQIADRAIRAQATPKPAMLQSTDGTSRQIMRAGRVDLPPKVIPHPTNGGTQLIPRKLGPGGKIRLAWPRFFEPTLDDILKAAQASVALVAGKLIDRKTAVEFLKNYLPIGDDVDAMLKSADDDAQAGQAQLAQQMMQGIQGRPPPKQLPPGK